MSLSLIEQQQVVAVRLKNALALFTDVELGRDVLMAVAEQVLEVALAQQAQTCKHDGGRDHYSDTHSRCWACGELLPYPKQAQPELEALLGPNSPPDDGTKVDTYEAIDRTQPDMPTREMLKETTVSDDLEEAIVEGMDDDMCACGEMETCCGDPGCCPMLSLPPE